jgi:anti-sigma factor RsiW
VNRLNDELLMRLHDGELSDPEVRELERRLASDPQASSVLEGLHQIGDVVRALASERSAAADGIADSVLARIEAEPCGSPPMSRPIPIRSRWTLPAVAATLAAAAALFVWLGRAPDPVESAPVATLQPRPALEPSAAAPVSDEDIAPAVEIETVDFGSHNGAIFMVSAGSESTPVVWLNDDAPPGDRTEPL